MISRAKWHDLGMLSISWHGQKGMANMETIYCMTMENHSGHIFSYCILRFNSPGWGILDPFQRRGIEFGQMRDHRQEPSNGEAQAPNESESWNLRMLKMLIMYQGAFQPWWWEGNNMQQQCLRSIFITGLRKTQNSIHPFVCFSASCPFCPRGHWLTLCISRCNKTYCTHRIDSEVIADLRFSASKISRLPPKILVPATLVPLPQFRDVICVGPAHATHMQHTCNTHATRHATRAFSLEISRKSAHGDENLHFPF